MAEIVEVPSDPVQDHSKRVVSYYYDCEFSDLVRKDIKFSATIGNYYYGQGHVMKPNRIKMTHHLVQAYGIFRQLDVYVSLVIFLSGNLSLYVKRL